MTTLPMTERDLQGLAADYLRLRGWLVFHARPARTTQGWATPVSYDGVGFPDLACARDGVVRLIEVKGPRGRLATAQQAWLDAADGYLLTPDRIDEFMSEFK